MKEPLVSIGIPTYNHDRWLEDCIESLTEQSYRNIEIIISDNCSTDRTGAICREYKQKDSRIRYYKQKSNCGAVKNFRFVFDQACGDYFMWAADDDLWEKQFIENGVKSLQENPDCRGWFSSLVSIDSYDRIIRKCGKFTRFNHGGSKYIDIIKFLFEPEILGKANIIYGLYQRNALETVINDHFVNENWGSDYSFVLAFLCRYKMIFSDKCLFKKRNPQPTDHPEYCVPVCITNPGHHIFPFRESFRYSRECFRATKSTKYWPIVLTVMFLRSFLSLRNALLRV